MTDELAVVIRIEFDEHWRVGTGTSASGLDDDQTWAMGDNSVCVPASHLKRVLRQRAEALAPLVGLVLCGGRLAAQDLPSPAVGHPGSCKSSSDKSVEVCAGCRLFGSPRVTPGWRFGPALVEQPDHLNRGQRTVLAAAQRQRSMHNRIDPWARRTAEDLLFSLENGRADLTATATAGYLFPGSPNVDELALLVAAVGGLEALGGRKRRGFGACRAWVEGAPGGRTHDEWVEVFVSHDWAGRVVP
ncbi:MAG: RAMP superfamily CRISPR-associated protein [Acidimicrobiales bacterium]